MRQVLVSSLVAAAIIAVFAAAPASAVRGGDVSQAFSTDTWSCAKRNGFEFMIARSYMSYGAADPNGRHNVENAKAAGIKYRDVYHFPCHGKISAAQQVKDDIDTVGKDNFGTMWFDIETNPSPGCGWSGNKADNCAFLKDLIDAGHSHGIRMGVYSSVYMWGSIMGDGCRVGADAGLPLWYAHYDGSETFSDFTSFGGWSKPAMKQYWDSVGFCGIGSDADWYP